MRRPLLIKYLFFVILAIISMFILLNTYGSNAITKALTDTKKNQLYNEADLISREFLQNYYSSNASLDDLKTSLYAVDTLLDTRTWFVRADGMLIFDTKGSDFTFFNVKDLQPDLFNYNTLENVYFDKYFDEPMLMAISSVIHDYKTKAYVLLFLPNSKIMEECIHITNVLNICALVVSLVLLISLLLFYLLSVRPIKKLMNAAKKYSDGDYQFEPELKSHDEFYQLQSAFKYMARELSSLDEYQKKFVANISHDFRSPLTSIKGYAEAILDGTIPYEMQNKYIEIIVFETERLTKLTSNLLTLNSYERNGALLKITSFDINAVIKKTVATFEGICLKKKLLINLEFSDKELYADADVDKIQQVLYNLVDNAIKFSHSNKSIKISTYEKNDKVFVSVKDFGIGIPKESISKVWDRFYKTDSSRGKDKKGTGLGLSIAKEIITAHKENINVISTEGVGTEFTFSLVKSEE